MPESILQHPDDALRLYAERHSSPEPPELYETVRAAHIHLINGRMCSGHLQGRLLTMLTRMACPRHVLELGTFAGYSALCIAEGLSDGATLTTVEHNDELEDFILSRFAASPYADRIRLLIGDALALMRGMEDASCDMIFIDADKRQYPAYYEECMRLLRRGGFILADNTLWDGHVTDAAYDRDPQTRGIRAFNDLVAADPRVEKVMLPLRDGLTIIRKI
ncbi:MAG: O-methyltransferase [Muribaculaceae bacterium]|nr:O-methyltransferase [Muribaculaceae bacterium]